MIAVIFELRPADPERDLSLSFFRDEEAVRAGRNTADHRAAQAEGRGGVLVDYRLRVAQMVRNYGVTPRV